MRPDRQVGAHLSVFRIFVWDRGNDGLAVCTEKNRHAASVAGIYKEVVDAGLLVDPDSSQPAEAGSLLMDLGKAFVLLFLPCYFASFTASVMPEARPASP